MPEQTTSPILVIIPCFNEAGSIAAVVNSVLALGPRFHPLVVDDGSTDNSYNIATTLCPTLRLCCNLGIGGAVQAGLRYALRNGYRYAAQIDGDGQHSATELSKLLQGMRDDGADLVVGSRYVQRSGFQSTALRRMGGQIIAKTIGLAFGVKVTDPTSGFRLMNHAAIELLAPQYPYDFPEPVSLAILLRYNLKITEVAVEMRERRHGRSSIHGLKSLAYMVRVLSFIVIARLRRQ